MTSGITGNSADVAFDVYTLELSGLLLAGGI
jgi:hypothetical protein